MKEIISFVSGKGGVGKSTISSLLSLYYSSYRKVLLIDADLGLTNLSIILRAKDNLYDIKDVIEGKCELNDAITKINSKLDLLNLCNFYDANCHTDHLLENILSLSYDNYDLFIIDGPAGIENGFLNIIGVTNKFVIVLNDEETSYTDVSKLVRILKNKNANNLVYVINKFNKKQSLKKMINEKIKLRYGTNRIYFFPSIGGDIYKKSHLVAYNKDFTFLANQLLKI